MAHSANQLPVITFDSDLFEISVKDKEEVYLQGVHANDAEDGNLSSEVFVYSISPFNENQERTITYGVFDKDHQMVMASRKFKYKDYSLPKFSSKKPLTSTFSSLISSDETMNVKATSSVDGDITNRISITKSESEGSIFYRYSVTDSTGTSQTLTVSEDISLKSLMMNVSIELKDYIVYVEKGKELNFRNYIQNVKTSIGYQEKLISDVDIETNYNAYQEGVYEVLYTLNRSNGDYGAVKMIVIVEDENGK